VRNSMPELPDARVSRFMREYRLSQRDADILVMEKTLADYFEGVAKLSGKPQLAASWISVELQRQLNERKASLENLRITPAQFARLLVLVDSGVLTGKLAKRVLAIMVDTGKDPDTISQELGLVRIADEQLLDSVVSEVFTENPRAVEDAQSNPEALNFLVGQVMRKTRGKADPAVTNSLVRKKLSELSSRNHC
jgi:aspartyl-tRNA(Asn)/glutamyl-tRNA(Gln) amidotransferase subunit B